MAVLVKEDAGRVSLKLFPQQIHRHYVFVGGFFYVCIFKAYLKISCLRKAV
nr:MAG TPA: hypothetical protein [Caudoviricetes sp.]